MPAAGRSGCIASRTRTGRNANIAPTEVTTQTSLHALIQAVANGDQDAFTELYNQYFPRLVRYVLNRVSSLDEAEAESIVQDVMFCVYRKAGTYNGSSDAQAASWLYRITHNRTIDITRAMRHFQEVELDADDSPMSELPDPDDDDDTRRAAEVDEEIRQYLNLFIQSLTPREREVLGLKVKGLRSNEIAGLVGVSAPRITQLMQNIQRKAKEYFDKLSEETKTPPRK